MSGDQPSDRGAERRDGVAERRDGVAEPRVGAALRRSLLLAGGGIALTVALVVLLGFVGPGRRGELPSLAFPSLELPSLPNVLPTLAPDADPILLAAGDIASCGLEGDSATAALLDRLPGTIAALGDVAYESGSERDFHECFEPTWGRHRDRIRPAIGNHEYRTDDGTPYFDYFGSNAGSPGEGWYSYDLGAWHVVVLNSNCGQVRCGAGSSQEEWLRGDLAANGATCTLAYWHHPRFSSGWHGSEGKMQPLWRTLYEADADVVVVAHDHDYERFTPLDDGGAPDPARGIRQFVVGTGGAALRDFSRPVEGSEVRDASTHGVLKLTLRDGGYDWRFVPVATDSFTDSGSGSCH